ncbi:helix-turn-helix transcriptional regulator [Shewanella sp. 3B26]|uniref:Helix-turn-helix transcriptional regulator n=1 Tax=Shewanella zhuhaiensis TaxID=2919576 RepID=A0AAJ1FAL1_9GAMM|nr:helix-turn-helix transcriptional regulator [Shewanella zhuhaiensis]MCH4294200.1 helix-turn-helix transcriptional regulator [Shewanella zhuhaiensis]
MMNERIKERRKAIGLTQQQVAASVGVSKATISLWENGTTQPKGENLHLLVKELKCSVEWLLYGQEKKSGTANAEFGGAMEPWSNHTPLGSDEVDVPFYTEVAFAAGAGAFASTENHGPKLRFSKSTLRRQGVEPQHAVCVKVIGTSMEPVLPNGSTVGIDLANTTVVDGKMYAINHDGMLRVKLVYRLPGNGLRLRSYNLEEYPDEMYSSDQSKSIQIVGRVFWYSVLL